MFGVFSMWLLGIMTYLFPRLLKTEWYSRSLCEWHYWLSALGIGLMSSDLIIAGPFQGYFWASLLPWDVSVDFSIPFWAVRLVAGTMMFVGLLAFLTNLALTWARSRPVTEPEALAVAVA
jgi:cytochrome c oxidase cbb3-type subunit I